MAKMDWLPWLKERWGTIRIPGGVWRELEKIGDAAAWDRLESARSQGWLVVMQEGTPRNLPQLKNLHCGEIDAIHLALDLNADWLIVDDGDARHAAKGLGIKIIGLLGMIVWAKKQGKLERALDGIADLRRITRFRVSGEVLAEIAVDLGETP